MYVDNCFSTKKNEENETIKKEIKAEMISKLIEENVQITIQLLQIN